MNLLALTTGAVALINPQVLGTVQISAGYTTAADGTPTPTFRDFPGISMQVQALTSGQIEHLDGLNIQGVRRAVYMNGKVEGLDRFLGKGGDLLIFGGQTWLVTEVLEPWDVAGWVLVAVTLQTS